MRNWIRAVALIALAGEIAFAASLVTPSYGSKQKKFTISCGDGEDCSQLENGVRVTKLVIRLNATTNKYAVYCAGRAVTYVGVRPGDWVAWRIDRGEPGKVKKLRFKLSLHAFGIEDKKIRLHGDHWTWMRVQSYADTCVVEDPWLSIYDYCVEDYDCNEPGPGIIVCPPTGCP